MDTERKEGGREGEEGREGGKGRGREEGGGGFCRPTGLETTAVFQQYLYLYYSTHINLLAVISELTGLKSVLTQNSQIHLNGLLCDPEYPKAGLQKLLGLSLS